MRNLLSALLLLLNHYAPVVAFAPSANSRDTLRARTHSGLGVQPDEFTPQGEVTRRGAFSTAISRALAVGTVAAGTTLPAWARLESVDRPDLLPAERGVNVIQTEKFLTSGQAKRMNDLLVALERDTGFRVRVLCQSYPNTPGLAIRDYWDLGKEGQKDDKYVVLVVDQFGGRGNVLNFNVGDGLKFALPNVFWNRLSSKYGTTFYVRDNGIDLAVTNAIEAIVTCLRSEDQYCVSVPEEAPSMKSLGLF
jgi:hypothetical protein|uniref:TPM domain-containing protein n=1 Tax=Phaeodactylum tricornutum TaxID=2850 RepID=A0A8J9T7L0_PHATR